MPTPYRNALPVLLMAVSLIVAVAAHTPPAAAQLPDTIWTENLSIQVDAEFGGAVGVDMAEPENLSDSVSGDEYGASGSITFAESAVPEVTCLAATNYQAGELQALSVNSFASVIFQWHVVLSGTGGPSVSSVPVNVTAQGSAEVTGDAATLVAANATLSIRVAETGEALFYESVVANNVGGGTPLSDSFALTQRIEIPPGDIAEGHMMAGAASTASFSQGPAVGNAMGFVDPIIEIADEIIPGSSLSYRDVYQVVFSPGYDAAGGSTPVSSSTTMGRLKASFRD